MKLLTVTVPCYNAENDMRKCLDSLLIGGERVEIIVIDDGSKDNTGVIADEYQAKYPTIIKVVHQENGGHGEGINSGLKNATGKYFKCVDSDDYLTDFVTFLDRLEKADSENENLDLVLTNYRYVHTDGKGDRSIVYSNVFKENKLLTWQDIGSFKIDQYVMIHSTTFKTQLIRDSKLVLPRKVFYEDNLYVFSLLPLVKHFMYFNMDLYNYLIGRAGQSVQLDVFTKRYDHQLKVCELLFKTRHLDEIKAQSKKLYNMMYHEYQVLLTGAVVYARKNGSPEAEENLKNMWKAIEDYDIKYANKLKSSFMIWIVSRKGKFGLWLCNFCFSLARKVVRFN